MCLLNESLGEQEIFFEFSQTFTSVSIYNSIETQRISCLFLLEHKTPKKRKQL